MSILKVSSSGGGVLTKSDKAKTPTETSGDFSETGLTITNTPTSDGYVGVDVNGLAHKVGNGSTSLECYFGTVVSSAVVSLTGGNQGTNFLVGNFAWGMGLAATLGDSTAIDKSSPISVIGNHSFAQLALTGTGSTCRGALKSDGTAWAWGTNSSGAVGDNTITDRSSPVSVVGNHSFISIVATATQRALKADGSVWSWGAATSGILGDNQTAATRSSPVSVVGNHSFIALGSIGGSGGALKADGSAWFWGTGTSGNCGDGAAANRSSPVSVIGNHSFIMLVAGTAFGAGLKSDGSAWGIGAGSNGSTGDNTTTNRSSPVSVVGNHSFIKIVSGGGCVTGLKIDGTAWAWGSNSSGQLGDGTITARSSPTSVIGNHSFTTIFGGAGSTFGTKSNRTIWAWGEGNTNGKLGDGNATNRSSPVSVLGIWGELSGTARNWEDITAGDKFIWNGTTAGFNLSSSDSIDFNYIYLT